MFRNLLVIVGISLVCLPAFLSFAAGTAHAGKNAGGALLVHTDDEYSWTDDVCDYSDSWIPASCWNYNTRTDKDESTSVLIWFIASWMETYNPGVTVIFFGNDHNLPQYSHDHWGMCGPDWSLELPDTGWPDSPATAGNSVAFASPVVGVTNIPFYYVNVWGFEGAYYGTGINPTGGYAAFTDDSNPPVQDECDYFGHVRWYEQGNNESFMCFPTWGACCWVDGRCTVENQTRCMTYGGYDWLPHVECQPDPCPPRGACCRDDDVCWIRGEDDCDSAHETWLEGMPCDPNPCGPTSSVSETATEVVTWGKVKSTYK